ncbi:MAG: STAS domain-containing protein [Cellvibrionaceae bacterium]
MSEDGRIEVAFQDNVVVLRLVGDVRLTLCTLLDDFMNKLFSEKSISSALVDASSAENLDSTTLGMLAKFSLYLKEHYQVTPVLYSTHPSVNRQLETMGLNAIFSICETLSDSQAWPEVEKALAGECGEEAKDTIIQAHKILMSLNDDNKAAFHDMVTMLENSEEASGF